MKAYILYMILLALILASCDQLPFFKGKEEMQLPNTTIQWAVRAKASSSFAGKYSQAIDDQSPSAATGEPEVEKCGSYEFERYAWAPAKEDAGLEWLELGFADKVFVSSVNIYEISEAGAITKVELLGDDGYEVIWEGNDPVKFCPDVLELTLVNMTEYNTNSVKITIDSKKPGWNMIDAVELIGYERRWRLINNTIVWGQ